MTLITLSPVNKKIEKEMLSKYPEKLSWAYYPDSSYVRTQLNGELISMDRFIKELGKLSDRTNKLIIGYYLDTFGYFEGFYDIINKKNHLVF